MANKKRGKSKTRNLKKIKNPNLIKSKSNKKRYWLIGGKIGAIVGLSICLISLSILLFYNSKCNEADNCMIDAPNHIKLAYNVFSVGSWPIIEFIKQGKMLEMTYIILGVLILIVEYFIIGAVIGIVVGRINRISRRR
jgi:hypothetical protein